MNRGPWKKWTPAMAAGAIIAALAGSGSIAAGARTDLPDRTPQDVLEMVAAHRVEGFSGRVVAAGELGLPQLPGANLGDGANRDHGATGDPPQRQGPDSLDARLAELLSLVAGPHEARVFVDGHDRFRLQLLDGTEEKNLIRDDAELWLYDSAENQAIHTTLPRYGPPHEGPLTRRHPDLAVPTPERIAEHLLDKAQEHSEVSVEEGISDSGRDAYTLRLDPRTDQTLVDTVSVDVDAETGMPLGVEVSAVGQDEPAISVAFTEFSPGAPDADLFDFQPPAGAAVEEASVPDPMMWHSEMMRHGEMMRRGHPGQWGAGAGEYPRGEVVGDGWDAVVVVSLDEMPQELVDSALLDELAVDVEGGRVLSTPLLTVLLTDDGEVLAGSVPQQRLLDIAAGTGQE